VHPVKKSLLAVLACLPAIGGAAPWMDVGDLRLRHSVQVLADAALIRVPVTAWPIMWSGVTTDVNRIRNKILTPPQRRAVEYISSEFERQTGVFNASLGAGVAGHRDPLRGFANTRKEEREVHIEAEYIAGDWAARLRLNQSENPIDGYKSSLDGSYISKLWGNWAITAGAIERWWGPSWESALLLSNAALPVPSISIQRNTSEPFDIALLRWLGPWQFVGYVGQLDGDRIVENAKLVGGRFNFRPLRWLELGISRSAQWGGEGRAESFDSFTDLIVGEREPANQLGGLDWRASWSRGVLSTEFYGEFVGEDHFRIFSPHGIATFGAAASFPVVNMDVRIYIESTDTEAKRPTNSKKSGYAYEHDIYQTGYRYRGRPIGAGIDNDAKANHLGAQIYLSKAYSIRLKYSEFELNRDNIGVNSIASNSSDGERVELEYKYISKHWELAAAYIHYSHDLQINDFSAGDNDFAFTAKYRF
jgi:hypothetical protein